MNPKRKIDPEEQIKIIQMYESGTPSNVIGGALDRTPKTICRILAKNGVELREKVSDLMGQTFGLLTVICQAPESTKAGKARWICKCECGNKVIRVGGSLTHGRKRSAEMSCGCLKGEIARNNGKRGFKDKTGEVYGHLTVIERAFNENDDVLWVCQCDCGNTITMLSILLSSTGRKKCDNHIYSKERPHPAWKGYEGISGTIWHRIVVGAEVRNLEFSITIEDAWKIYTHQNGKCALTGWIIDFPPTWRDTKEGTASLDRIDSNRGYIKGNIQWVHKDINWLKNKWNQEYFIEMCVAIAEHLHG